MSIRENLAGLRDDLDAAYTAVQEMGGQVTEAGGSSLLPAAIRTIPQGASEAAGVFFSGCANLQVDNVQAALEEIARTLPVRREVTLTASGWTGDAAPYAQTVDVPGVLADELAQLVRILPVGLETWAAAGMRCTGQGAGTLTFSAREKPVGDVKIYIVIQEVVG